MFDPEPTPPPAPAVVRKLIELEVFYRKFKFFLQSEYWTAIDDNNLA